MPERDPRHDPRPGDRLRVTIEICEVSDHVVHYIVAGAGDCADIVTGLAMRVAIWRILTQGQVEVLHVEETRE